MNTVERARLVEVAERLGMRPNALLARLLAGAWDRLADSSDTVSYDDLRQLAAAWTPQPPQDTQPI